MKQTNYDMIIVGSGNRACGFLSHYLQHCDRGSKVLVGGNGGDNFFNTGKFDCPEDFELITAIVKYNPATEGEYKNNSITLDFFATDGDTQYFNQDKEVAKKVIADYL